MDDHEHDEWSRVMWWRRRKLRELGIDSRLATMYADTADYHDVETLAARTGWTVDQAFEVLRP